MKIGLNATCFNNRPSGARQRFVGIYGELIKRLPDAEFVLYEPTGCPVSSWFPRASNLSTRQTPLPSEGRAGRFIRGFRYWDSALEDEELDIFEGFSLPFFKPPSARSLMTLHDMRRMRPEAGALDRLLFKTTLEGSFKAIDHVIAVSEAMREEILGFYPGLSVSVIYNGLDGSGFERITHQEMSEVRRKFALPEEFILAVGHFEKRKNYVRLINAMARLRDRGRFCPLLIVGNNSGLRKTLEEQVASKNLASYVRMFSGLSDLEVRCLYKLCSLFVFPSSYEGFGIPILEAMAAGCPMVLSDIPVFREITQDTGVYFPPDDVGAMAFAIETLLSSNTERARLIEYGKQRVQAFSFRNLATRVEYLYRSLT